MWIEANGAHKRVVDAAKLDTIELSYKGRGNWAVVGTVGDRSILLQDSFPDEKAATDYLVDLLSRLD